MKRIISAISALVLAVFLFGCDGFNQSITPPDENRITSFELGEWAENAVIDEYTINISVEDGTDITSVIPRIHISDKATLFPVTEAYLERMFSNISPWEALARIGEATDLDTCLKDMIQNDPHFKIPELDIPIDFSVPVYFLVMSGKGTVRIYVVFIEKEEKKLPEPPPVATVSVGIDYQLGSYDGDVLVMLTLSEGEWISVWPEIAGNPDIAMINQSGFSQWVTLTFADGMVYNPILSYNHIYPGYDCSLQTANPRVLSFRFVERTPPPAVVISPEQVEANFRRHLPITVTLNEAKLDSIKVWTTISDSLSAGIKSATLGSLSHQQSVDIADVQYFHLAIDLDMSPKGYQIFKSETELGDYADRLKAIPYSGWDWTSGTGFIEFLDNYNADFFQDNNLVMIMVEETSGSNRHEVKSVFVENDTLYINVDRILPNGGDTDMAHWHILVPVRKDFFNGDTVIVTMIGIPWAYTVTFDNNGGSTEASPMHKVVVPPATTIDALPVPPTWAGYDFACWSTLPGEAAFTENTPVTANITVYARWVFPPITFYVTFDSNGGDTAANPTVKDANPSWEPVVPATMIVRTLPVPPTRAGYAFIGWNTSVDGSGAVFTENTDVMLMGDITVYAQWLYEDRLPRPDLDMVWIQPGTFTMGSPETEFGRGTGETQHSVSLTQGFYMGKYPVTQAQYEAVMGSLPVPGSDDYGRGDNYPVYGVSWYDAIVFCNRSSMQEGLSPAYSINGSTDPAAWGSVSVPASDTWDDGPSNVPPIYNNTIWDAVTIVTDSTGYRLPTEAQWEYACRAGTTTAFNWGTDYIDSSKANYNARIVTANNTTAGTYLWKTTEVGSYAPNAWGLYDMHGNVWEWCWDWYGSYSGVTQTDPTGAVSGTFRVIRGGSGYNDGQCLRSPYRFYYYPSIRGYGFRLARP